MPVSLVAAIIDLVSKGDREGSLFYRVLRWGANSDQMLDAYQSGQNTSCTIETLTLITP